MTNQDSSDKKLRLGVVGAGRGRAFMQQASAVGMQLVAICETQKDKLEQAAQAYGVAAYTDFERFLDHGLDAIALANYMHDHAPLAVQALRRGMHVLSECMAARSLAQCVELVEAVEASGCIYMLAENYPYMRSCQELRRLYHSGEIGHVRYAEGEYNHPGREDWFLSISPGLEHWRLWLPPTYYVTHALAPLMMATDTLPVRVNALSIVEEPTQSPHSVKVSDVGSVILCRMDNGAVFRIWGLGMSSIHRIRYDLHGERGLISTAEPDPWSTVRIHHEPWLAAPGQEADRVYSPDWPGQAELAEKAGHGGGDFWTSYDFANAIRQGQPPYLDVYRATAMSAVSILGWRSCLEDGRPYAIPNFHNPADRQAFREDRWSPFPEDAGPGQPPPSLRGYVPPSPEAVARAEAVWSKGP
jgi:predicted dehydrogenase